MFDLYPDMEPFLVTLARECFIRNISYLYGEQYIGVRYKVQQNIKNAIAFELTDKGDYSTLVGKIDGLPLPHNPGRAFFKGNPPVTFQSALYSSGSTEAEMNASLLEIAKTMAEKWNGPLPRPIPVMPDTVTADNLKNEYNQGYIANVEAAGGTGRPVLGRGFLLGFTDRWRYALLGNVNNVNESRHIGEHGHWSPATMPQSLLTTRSVATDLDYQSKDKNVTDNFNADFTSSNTESEMRQRYEQFLEGSKPMSLTENRNEI